MRSADIFLLMAMVLILGLIILIGLLTFDTLTIEMGGTKSVPCVDHNGNLFEDELCEEEIICSMLGIAQKRCSEDLE